jgi:hypothetical protein
MAITREKNNILSTFLSSRINIYDAGGVKPSLGVHFYEQGSVGETQIGKVERSEGNFTIGNSKMVNFVDSSGTNALQVIKFITELYEQEMEAFLVAKEELEAI